MLDLIDEVPGRYLREHPLDRYIPLPGPDLKPEGYDPGLVAMAGINNLIWAARAALHAKDMAESWRDYRVGAAALVYNFKRPAMGLYLGANIKPEQGKGLNLHAEQIAIAKARRAGMDHVIGMAVWGDPSDLDANPGQSPTLRVCRRCDGMCQCAPEIKPQTYFISANQNLSACEFYTAGELQSYYENPDARGPINEVPVYSLADDMDDDVYNNEIFLPYLLPKVTALYSLAA